MSDPNDLTVPSYIGRKPCGCVIAAVVDDGTTPKMVADALRDFVMDGLTIERVTVGWVRTNKFGCDHKETKETAPAQLALELKA